MLYEELKKEKLYILNDAQQLHNLMLVAALSCFSFWLTIYFYEASTWYYNIALPFSLYYLIMWITTKKLAVLKQKIHEIHIFNCFLVTSYAFSLCYVSQVPLVFYMLSIFLIGICGSTISRQRHLIAYFSTFVILSLLLPQTNPIYLKWFFSLCILWYFVIQFIQFDRRSKAIQFLQDTQKRFDHFSEGHYGGIFVFIDNTCLELNSTMRSIFSIDKHKKVSEMSVREIFGSEAYIELTELCQLSQRQSLPIRGELEVSSPLRPSFTIEYTLKPIELSGATVFVLFVQDLSPARESQNIIENQASTLKKVSRLTELGELSAGIAHEINNPLAIITGMAEEIQFQAEDLNSELNRNHILFLSQKIMNSTERITKIIRGIKTFARDGSKDPMKLEAIGPMLHDSIEICAISLNKKNINVHTKGFEKLSSLILCRRVQLEQVFVNIINNAADAISEQKSPWIQVQAHENDSHIFIEFVDSGYGIPPQEISKIFQDYYTTKKAGQGTGLGLSIARQILLDHQSEIYVDTTKEHTTFVISLPKYQLEKSTEAKPKP